MNLQASFNPNNVLAAYNFNTVMQEVAKFYCDYTRGLGIDLYWVRKDFTKFGPSYTPENLPLVAHQERFTGEIRHEYKVNDSTNSPWATNVLASASSFIAYDNRLMTPPFDTQFNMNLYKQLSGNRPKTEFIRESRDPNLPDFIKLVLLDRRCDLQVEIVNGQIHFFATVRDDNAMTPIINHDRSLQGSWVCVAAVADEGVAMKGVRRHYTQTEFIQQLVWAIAHEIGHLLIGGTEFPHPEYLMTGGNPTPAGISVITAGRDEINLIDLRNRRSVVQ